MSSELDRMRERTHDDLVTYNQNGIEISCIIIDTNTWNEIVSKCESSMTKIDGSMNVMYDKEGHVFVDLQFTIPEFNIIEEFLIDASQHLDFFVVFAKTGMLGIIPGDVNHDGSRTGIGIIPGDVNHDGSKIFVIQMPRIDNIKRSLDIIYRELEHKHNAVTGI